MVAQCGVPGGIGYRLGNVWLSQPGYMTAGEQGSFGEGTDGEGSVGKYSILSGKFGFWAGQESV